jgi:hypothetical protein
MFCHSLLLHLACPTSPIHLAPSEISNIIRTFSSPPLSCNEFLTDLNRKTSGLTQKRVDSRRIATSGAQDLPEAAVAAFPGLPGNIFGALLSHKTPGGMSSFDRARPESRSCVGTISFRASVAPARGL